MSVPASCAQFERRLAAPTGYVLPVQRWTARASAGWISEIWQLRRGRLLPGAGRFADRLSPAARLAARCRAADDPLVVPADPFAERGALPDPATARSAAGGRSAAPPLTSGIEGAASARNVTAGSPRAAVRTALTVEPRDGRLCVFMPPVERLEDYLDLLAAVEATAAELNLPVHIEGYPPPSDPRLNVIKVTPDPGVIEVNIHPARRWREAVDITRTLYEEARLCRLGTDKFMIDGRHTGTGGGNHVVLGGHAARTVRSCAGPTC